MKVAFLTTQERGGPVDLTVRLALELHGREKGPRVTVVGPEPDTSAGELGPLLRVAHATTKTDVAGARSVAAAIVAEKPDLVHAQDRRAGLVAAAVCRRRVPVVSTYHGVPDSAASWWVPEGPLGSGRIGLAGASRMVADAFMARVVDVTVAPSRAVARFLQERLRVPSDKLAVILNGVAVPARATQPGAVETFTSVSTFSACKAVPTLVNAFARVARSHPHVRLRLVGDGEERPLAEDRAVGLGVADQVELTGFRRDVPSQLAKADAFVLPSLNENLPLALLEAMAAGLPCVASAIGGVPEALGDGTGILVAPGDEAALAAAMEGLVKDPDRARALGSRARRRAESEFSLRSCADAHLELWRRVTGDAT